MAILQRQLLRPPEAPAALHMEADRQPHPAGHARVVLSRQSSHLSALPSHGPEQHHGMMTGAPDRFQQRREASLGLHLLLEPIQWCRHPHQQLHRPLGRFCVSVF